MVTVKSVNPVSVQLTLEPNQSLSSEVQLFVVITFVVFFVVVAMIFLLLGAWMVVPLILLEGALLVFGLRLVHDRTKIKEKLSVGPDSVHVLKLVAGKKHHWCFRRSSLRLKVGCNHFGDVQKVTLCGDLGMLDVGHFLNESDRKQLLSDLRSLGFNCKKTPQLGLLVC